MRRCVQNDCLATSSSPGRAAMGAGHRAHRVHALDLTRASVFLPGPHRFRISKVGRTTWRGPQIRTGHTSRSIHLRKYRRTCYSTSWVSSADHDNNTGSRSGRQPSGGRTSSDNALSSRHTGPARTYVPLVVLQAVDPGMTRAECADGACRMLRYLQRYKPVRPDA